MTLDSDWQLRYVDDELMILCDKCYKSPKRRVRKRVLPKPRRKPDEIRIKFPLEVPKPEPIPAPIPEPILAPPEPELEPEVPEVELPKVDLPEKPADWIHHDLNRFFKYGVLPPDTHLEAIPRTDIMLLSRRNRRGGLLPIRAE